MKHALLIHGWPNKAEYYNPQHPTASNSHWFPWLSKQLMNRDIHTVAIEMPKAYYPEYEIWKRELERFEPDQNTILVGHSCGAGFLVRYLSENNIKVGKLILVAPWLGIMFGDNKPFDKSFFDFKIDQNLTAKTTSTTLVESTNDMPQIQESAKILKTSIDNLKILTLKNKGHFTFEDLGTIEFPELLEDILL
jgi:predicted alpha/beta hydrolase family esterase